MRHLFSSFKRFVAEILEFLGGVGILSYEVFQQIFTRPFYPALLIDQIYQLGLRSTLLVLLTALSTGMVMALQFGLGLEKFGGKLYVPKLVSVSIVREMGPVFTSLMLAARIGAGIASEIGSMVVTQQVDAIRALGTSPIKKIVIPRVLASLLCVPLLATFAILTGIFGGLIVGVSELRLDPFYYFLKVINTLTLTDYLSGFCKTFFFSFFISIPSCYFGLSVKDGTRGVGTATTKAVVVASNLILLGDFVLTKLFWIIEKWH